MTGKRHLLAAVHVSVVSDIAITSGILRARP